jgi:hypothetical protein
MKRIVSCLFVGLTLAITGCANEVGGSSPNVEPTDTGLDAPPAEPPADPAEEPKPPKEGADDQPPADDGRPDDGRPDDNPDDNSNPPPTSNAVCGNGVAEDGELCDGADLADLTCRSAGFASGSVQCGSTCNSVRTTSCTALTATPIAQPGNAVNLSGALEPADPTWKRPNAECAEGFSEGQAFDAYAIVNNSSQQRQIQVRGEWGESDGFLHLFSSPWNPITGHGCLLGNDDFEGTGASLIPQVTIAPGQTLIVAVSAYSAGQHFPYQVFVDTIDPQNPPVVGTDPQPEPDPEPGSTPTCGNGIVEAGEQCDGTSLGGATCASAGYDFGIIACLSSCQLGLGLCFDLGGGDDPDPTEPDPVDPPPTGPVTEVADPGLTMQLSGVLDDTDAQFTRPTESCSASSTTGQRYETHRITNSSSTTRSLTLRANWDGDGFLGVYTDAFDPANAATGCLDADDDHSDNGAGAQAGSQVEDMLIFPGETLVVVATTFGADDKIGDYTIDVTSKNNGDAAPIASIASPGGTISTAGTLHSTDGKWQRMNASCEAGSGGDYLFDGLKLKNETGTSQHLDVDATWNQGDGFLHAFVYDASNDPVGNGLCLDANDDGTSASNSSLSNLLILSNETLVIVASTYAADTAIGSYEIDVSTRN